MPTLTKTELRRAIGGLIDEAAPGEFRTITADAGGSSTTLVAKAYLLAVPDDPAIFVGGFFRRNSGTVAQCTAFSQSTWTATVTDWGTAPTDGEVLEFWRNYHPAQVDAAIDDFWRAHKRLLWVPTSEVRHVHEPEFPWMSLPATWTGFTALQTGTYRTGAVALVQIRPALLQKRQLLGDVAANTRVSQSFSFTADRFLKYVAFQLWRVGSLAGKTITLAIQGNSGGNPDGTDIATATISGDDISQSPEWRVFTLSNPVFLDKNTTYHAVLRTDLTLPSTAYLYIGTTDGDDDYADGTMKRYNGSTWSALNVDAFFALYEEPPYWWEVTRSRIHVEPLRGYSVDYNTAWSIRQGNLIRLIGIREPAQPSATAELEIPFAWAMYSIAFSLVAARLKDRQSDLENMDVRLRTWGAMSAGERMTVVRPRPEGTKLIVAY